MRAGALRVGLLGAGRWGRRIISTIESISQLRLTHVFSRNEETRALVGPGCRIHDSWPIVCESSDVDAIIVATPPSLHAQMTMRALQAGKAVFVEKPFTLSLPDAEAISALAELMNAVLHINHIDLRNAAWETAKRHIERMDPALSIDARFGSAGPPNLQVPPRWDWGSHPVALACDLFGQPVRVGARSLSFEELDTGLIEVVEIDLAFSGGRTAHIVAGNGFEGRQRGWSIRTAATTLIYDDQAPGKLLRSDGSPSVDVEGFAERPLARALRRFASDAILGRAERIDVELGVSVVRTLEEVDRQLGTAVVTPALGGSEIE